LPVLLLWICGFIFIGCSGGGIDDYEAADTQGTGAIALSLRIDDGDMQRLQRQAARAEFECVANGIVTIEVIVYDQEGETIAFGGPFACETGEGLVSGVEAGINRTVVVLAKDESGLTIFRGEVMGVVVIAGETTDVGPVTLFPVLNRPPVLEPIGPQSVFEGEMLKLSLTASDPDADNRLTFSASSLPPGALFNAEDQEFVWSTEIGDTGVYRVLFVVTDDGDPPLSDSESVTVSVGAANRPPVLEPIGDKMVKVGEFLEFTVSANDPDGNMLTYQATNLPEENLFDPETQLFSWTPGSEKVGSYQILFAVFDDGAPSESDTEEVTITVGATNRPPEFDPIGNQEVDEGEFLEFVVTAVDPDDDLLTYEVFDLPEGASFDPELQKFQWQTGIGDVGTFTVLFSVRDDREPPLNDSMEVTITVGDINQPPEFTPTGSVIGGTEGNPIQFRVIAEDPDGDALTYTARSLPFGANFINQSFFWIPGFQDAGTYRVTFTVVDDGDPPLRDEMEVLIRVGDFNQAPSLAPIGDQIVNFSDFIEETPFLEFTVSGSDPDSNSLSYSADNLPAGFGSDATFDSDTQTFLWPIITFSDIGSYQVRFTVNDNGSPPLSDSETVTIVVGDNNPPFFTSVNGQTAGGGIPVSVFGFEGSPLVFDVQATDPDEDQLTYTVTGLPSGAIFDPATQTVSWASPVNGTYPLEFTVTDDGVPVLSATQEVTLIIELFG